MEDSRKRKAAHEGSPFFILLGIVYAFRSGYPILPFACGVLSRPAHLPRRSFCRYAWAMLESLRAPPRSWHSAASGRRLGPASAQCAICTKLMIML
jgi:hypothetical protein